jgi:PAS domain S-box-containing protein
MQTSERADALKGLPSGDTLFRAVWEMAGDAMALSDAAGTVIAANPAYYDLYGYADHEVIGRPFTIIFPPEEREAAMEQYRRFFGEDVRAEGIESAVRRKDGTTREVDVRYSFIEREGRRVAMLSVIRDITDRARLRDAERGLTRQKNDFLLAVAHDLRTPITGILGYAQLLQRRLARDGRDVDLEAMEQGLQRVEATAARMNRRIGEILEAAAADSGQAVPLSRSEVDLSEVVRRVAALQQQAASGHEMGVHTDDAPVVGVWDADRIERIVENLISNAVKYSPDGGPIELTVRREGDEAVLSVADGGIGIAAADLPHIFERFYRSAAAERGISGFGIGLAAVRAITERHGGTIEVESTEGRGTTFTVRLPLQAPPEE